MIFTLQHKRTENENLILFSLSRAPHWSVNIGYLFMKIDSWDTEHSYLTVDNTNLVSNVIYNTS